MAGMKPLREREHARNEAMALTIVFCVLVEGLGLLAALRSAFWPGPVSLWMARPVYRRLLRAKLKPG